MQVKKGLPPQISALDFYATRRRLQRVHNAYPDFSIGENCDAAVLGSGGL